MRIAEALTTAGTEVDKVPVLISLRIIELFSAGLYSSPTKAVEELVANSYDAMAERVSVYLPDSFDDPDAVLWVKDNGESMDLDEFHALWQIGASPKAAPGRDAGPRKQIGKFGIGKLATYVLSNNLTFMTFKDGRYLAISMDYGKVRDEEGGGRSLQVRVLPDSQANTGLARILQ